MTMTRLPRTAAGDNNPFGGTLEPEFTMQQRGGNPTLGRAETMNQQAMSSIMAATPDR